ncbi:hypothetical protein [Paracidovorax valerianellae]|uniref:hypothetical protein n=1 Tax=Paracidovorax valerianellae TaxID=187868 RepID=UPI0011136D69|nr:hypothetical protein [Paracidovorax valerianellae]MDA8447257.1 hypothetical protein [Paracidovorax valerianellae]
MDIAKIKVDIGVNYINPRVPEYKVVNDLLESNIYQDVWLALQVFGQVFDFTDANDDVAFFWLVNSIECKGGFSVQLSAVGRYAVIVDLEKSAKSAATGSQILSLLESFGFYIFDHSELFTPVFREFSQQTVYQWLFSEVSRPPPQVISKQKYD